MGPGVCCSMVFIVPQDHGGQRAIQTHPLDHHANQPCNVVRAAWLLPMLWALAKLEIHRHGAFFFKTWHRIHHADFFNKMAEIVHAKQMLRAMECSTLVQLLWFGLSFDTTKRGPHGSFVKVGIKVTAHCGDGSGPWGRITTGWRAWRRTSHRVRCSKNSMHARWPPSCGRIRNWIIETKRWPRFRADDVARDGVSIQALSLRINWLVPDMQPPQLCHMMQAFHWIGQVDPSVLHSLFRQTMRRIALRPACAIRPRCGVDVSISGRGCGQFFDVAGENSSRSAFLRTTPVGRRSLLEDHDRPRRLVDRFVLHCRSHPGCATCSHRAAISAR